jgi:hypothetical protein
VYDGDSFYYFSFSNEPEPANLDIGGSYGDRYVVHQPLISKNDKLAGQQSSFVIEYSNRTCTFKYTLAMDAMIFTLDSIESSDGEDYFYIPNGGGYFPYARIVGKIYTFIPYED